MISKILGSVKISTDKPPVWDNARALFKFNPNTVLFAYGDTIYNPGAVNLEKAHDIIVHEMVHIGQQMNSREDAALWWGKYMRDKDFRLSQEVEAYGKQYHYICTRMTQNKQLRFNALKAFATILSGPMYGNMVDFHEGMKLIKQKANI